MGESRAIEIIIDDRTFGSIGVDASSGERAMVVAALKLPGVEKKLKADGVSATTFDGNKYRIYTRLSRLSHPQFDIGEAGVAENPFGGLDIPLFPPSMPNKSSGPNT
jgi:hypothetical protein